jgi:hypothetical protein
LPFYLRRGLGTAAYPLGSRFHLNDFTLFVILSTVTFVVGYAWEHLDARCGQADPGYSHSLCGQHRVL